MAGTFVQDGLEALLKTLLYGQAAPSALKMALVTDASVAADAVWGDLTEVSGTGYAQVTVEMSGTGFPTAANVSTNAYHLKTKSCVFTAGGDWTGAKCAVLVATIGGNPVLIGWGALADTRTLHNGDTETVDLDLTLTEA